MVSNVSISYMVISIFITIVVIFGTLIYFRKTEKISMKPVIFGALTFIIFSQVLEKLMHIFVITNNLFSSPLAFSIYGALAAGIFEECGRFIVFKTMLKKNHQWKDGIAFGIGQGGIEAIVFGIISAVNYIVISTLINAGTFESSLGSSLPAESLSQLKSLLTGPSSAFLAIGIERTFAFIMQIGLTMVVLHGIRSRKSIYLLFAILLHAVMDIPAALYQMKFITNLWVIEGIFFLFSLIALLYIVKSKEVFKKIIND
jgi:uncharacterized membrane protein YhfC